MLILINFFIIHKKLQSNVEMERRNFEILKQVKN